MILDIFFDSKKELGLYFAKAKYDTYNNSVTILKGSKWSQKITAQFLKVYKNTERK